MALKFTTITPGKMVKIKTTRAVGINGTSVPAGEVVEVEEKDAKLLIGMRKAELCEEPQAADPDADDFEPSDEVKAAAKVAAKEAEKVAKSQGSSKDEAKAAGKAAYDQVIVDAKAQASAGQ
jgi:hypothetical protein